MDPSQQMSVKAATFQTRQWPPASLDRVPHGEGVHPRSVSR
jgi:hypothetical protein